VDNKTKKRIIHDTFDKNSRIYEGTKMLVKNLRRQSYKIWKGAKEKPE